MFKNWKTSLAGAIGGGVLAIQPLLEGNEVNLRSILTGFVVFVIGALAKDFNKTGL